MKHNVLFCGADEKTFLTLARDKNVTCVATNLLPEFLTIRSLHPIEKLFAKTYRALFAQKKQAIIWLLLLNCCFYFGTHLTKKYSSYLNVLWKKRVIIIDFSHVDSAVSFIKKHAIDLMVVSTWWLLPNKIIYAPRFGTMNIHPSKLPKYRGSVPTLWALKYHDTLTAVSFMLLNDQMDGGDLLAQVDIPILETDDAITLEHKCNKVIADNLANIIHQYLHRRMQPIRQDPTLVSKTARYYEYQRIDWQQESCQEIINKIKLYPYAWPLDYCYLLMREQRIYITRADVYLKLNKLREQFADKPYGYCLIKRAVLYIKARDGIIYCRLFIDISLKNSLFLMKNVHFHNQALIENLQSFGH